MKIVKEREFLILFKILPERIKVEPMFWLCSLIKILTPRLANNKRWCYNLMEESEVNDKLASSVQDLVPHSKQIGNVSSLANNSHPGVIVSLESSPSLYPNSPSRYFHILWHYNLSEQFSTALLHPIRYWITDLFCTSGILPGTLNIF